MMSRTTSSRLPDELSLDDGNDDSPSFGADGNPSLFEDDGIAEVAGSRKSSDSSLVEGEEPSTGQLDSTATFDDEESPDEADEIYGDPAALGGGIIGMFKSGPTVDQIKAAGGVELGMRVEQLVAQSERPCDDSQLITDIASFRAGLKEAPAPIVAEPFTLA